MLIFNQENSPEASGEEEPEDPDSSVGADTWGSQTTTPLGADRKSSKRQSGAFITDNMVKKLSFESEEKHNASTGSLDMSWEYEETSKGNSQETNNNTEEKVTAFQGERDVLSNFYPCKIHLWNKTFASSEHAYQFEKALYSNKVDSALKIMESPNARSAKRLSKEISTDEAWQANRLNIMREIIRAKAKYVPEFREALLSSEKVIAEAVPRDMYWSCGLSKSEVKTTPQKDWPGENVMGQLLMELREELMEKCSQLQVGVQMVDLMPFFFLFCVLLIYF